MNEFLEILKVRHAECQKRFLAKQAAVNAANTEFQAVAQEFNSIQTLMNLEMRKEQIESAANVQSPTSSASSSAVAPQLSTSVPVIMPPHHGVGSSGELNKTEMVRELLRQHASGMTPRELWKDGQIKAQFPHRAYLYSILKRLKDKGDITEKRGKYRFKFSPKLEEDKQLGMVQ